MELNSTSEKIQDVFIPFNKSFPLEVMKADGDDKGEIKGYASVFENKDFHNDIMVKGAFKKSIKEKKGKWPVLLNHKPDNMIGLNMEAEEDNYGLKIKSKLFIDDENIPKAKEAFAIVMKAKKYGHKLGLSVGGFVTRIQPEYVKDKGWIFRILEFDLMEHSITPFPANPKAVIKENKSLFEKHTKLDQSLTQKKNSLIISQGINTLKEIVESY